MPVRISGIAQVLLAAETCLLAFAGICAIWVLKGGMEKRKKAIFAAQSAVVAAAMLAAGALAMAITAFLTNDFTLEMVRASGSGDLAWPDKIVALWANERGAMLLWSVLLVLVFGLWRVVFRTADLKFDALSMIVGCGICFCFSAFVVFIVRPFAPAVAGGEVAVRLHPLLASFWALIHLPLLFIGYSALFIPFAALIAAVFANRAEIPGLYSQMRLWLLTGIVYAGLGMAAGAKWSYLEFGSGRYWSWAAAENASLVPMLAALAALHSLMGMRFSHKFGFWSMFLVPLPFVLCISGLFITKNGMLRMVQPAVVSGVVEQFFPFLVVLCAFLWLFAVMIAARGFGVVVPRLGPPLLDKANLMFCAVILFVILALAIGIGPWQTVLSSVFSSAPDLRIVSLRGFYEGVTAALGMILAVFVGLSALVPLTRQVTFGLQLLASLAAGLVGYAEIIGQFQGLVISSLASAICIAAAVAVIIRLFVDFKASNLPAQISHLAFLLLVAAIGFSINGTRINIPLHKNDTIMLGSYTVTYGSMQEKTSDGEKYIGPELVLTKGGYEKTLWPHDTIYEDGKTASNPAVHSDILQDVYASFDGVEDDGEVVVTVHRKPLMTWFWAGLMFMSGGSAIAMTRRQKTS